MELDGVDDYVKVNNTSYSLLPTKHEFTLEYVLTFKDKFYVYGLNHHYWDIWYKSTSEGYIMRSMNKSSNGVDNNWPIVKKLPLQNGSTYTITETYKLKKNNIFEITYYINGVKYIPDNNLSSASAYKEYLTFGREYDESAFSSGNLKSIRVFDRALTDSEIFNNYEIDKLRFKF